MCMRVRSWSNCASCVRPSSSPFAAVISAHPIHSLDNHHHHYHMGSLASPTRSYFYHQGSGHPRPHACATPISHLDRVESTGERPPPAGQKRRRAHLHSSVHSCAAAISLRLCVFKPFVFSPVPPKIYPFMLGKKKNQALVQKIQVVLKAR